MPHIREVLREAAIAVSLGTFIEIAAIALFLVGVAVAFILAIMP